MKEKFLNFYNLVKFPHTVFALPFAFIGFVLGITDNPQGFTWVLLIKILGAMVFARNSAMGFNRYADRTIDSINPRTGEREIPSGKISPKGALTFTLINVFLFMAVSYSINLLCLILSVPALVVLLGYSYTKRFTWLCHFVLGVALAIAPVGAYISVTGVIGLPVAILFFVVLLWVSGFDIIYSLSDEEFDKERGLNSVPQRFGLKRALGISSAVHIMVVPLLILLGMVMGAGWLFIAGAGIFTFLLLYQHLIVSDNDLSRVNAAFFTSNGVASVLFAIFTIADILF